MSQYKTVLNLLASVIFLIICSSLTGCATIAVEQFIHHPKTNVTDELSPDKKEYLGIYYGIAVIKDRSYAHIVIVPDCEEMQSLNLFLPTEKNYDTEAIVRVGGSNKEQLLYEDKYIGRSVKILSLPLSDDMKTEIDKGTIPMRSSLQWSGHPTTLIILFKQGDLFGKGAQKTLIYRIGPENNDFLQRSLTVDCKNGPCGNWRCKNKENNVGGYMLKPFAVVFDIITFPVQILVITLALIVGSGGP